MAHGQPVGRGQFAQVEQRQAARKQLAKDHPLAKARRQPEADAPGQILKRVGDLPLVAGVKAAQPVAHDDPVDGAAVTGGSALALVEHHGGVVTERRPAAVGDRLRQHVEIDEAVVQRRHQGVGKAVAEPAQLAVDARRVDDDDVATRRQIGQRRREGLGEVRVVVGHRHRPVDRQRQVDLGLLGIGRPVVDVAGQGALPGIEVQGPDGRAGAQQRHDQMHRGGRFPAAALLVADDDHMGGQPTAVAGVRGQEVVKRFLGNALPLAAAFQDIHRAYSVLCILRLTDPGSLIMPQARDEIVNMRRVRY